MKDPICKRFFFLSITFEWQRKMLLRCCLFVASYIIVMTLNLHLAIETDVFRGVCMKSDHICMTYKNPPVLDIGITSFKKQLCELQEKRAWNVPVTFTKTIF